MKTFSLQLSKIVGTSTEKVWSQVHVFTPDDREKLSRRGQLLAVISLDELKENVEVVAFGREIISRLHEEYYGRLDSSPLEQLEKAVKKVVAEVGSGARAEIAAAAAVGDILYLAISGQGRLMLRRRDWVATVLSGDGNASGHLKKEDIFLLGTGEIFKVIPEEKLKDALATGSPEEAIEELIPLVHTQDESGAIVGLIAKVEKKTEEKKAPSAAFLNHAVFRRLRLRGLVSERVFFLARTRLLLSRIKRKMRRGTIYLTQKREKRKRSEKMAVGIALILLLILTASVFLGRRQRKYLAQEERLGSLLKEARAKKEEGEALLELNPLKARELLLEAQGLVQTIGPEDALSQSVIEFRQDLEVALSQVLREHQVEPQVYFDLELIKEGARGHDWDVLVGRLFILDKEKSTVYSLVIGDKKAKILTGGKEIKGAFRVAAFSSRVFLLAGEGIVKVDERAGGQDLVVKADESWEEAVDLCAFGGNLYLLDRKSGIWRYPGIEGGFGAKQAWLKTEEEVDFSDAVSIAIDGAIWVLKSDGSILKYMRGKKDAFGVAGLDKPLSGASAIYTDSEQEYLYILDKDNSRVVVLAKSGEYDSQYYWEGIKETDSLIATGEKIFLLNGSKIYEIEKK